MSSYLCESRLTLKMIDNCDQAQVDHQHSSTLVLGPPSYVPVDVERIEPRHHSFGIEVNCEDFPLQLTLIPDSRTSPREPQHEVANNDSKK